MYLSQYIKTLQDILSREGDMLVVDSYDEKMGEPEVSRDSDEVCLVLCDKA